MTLNGTSEVSKGVESNTDTSIVVSQPLPNYRQSTKVFRDALYCEWQSILFSVLLIHFLLETLEINSNNNNNYNNKNNKQKKYWKMRELEEYLLEELL